MVTFRTHFHYARMHCACS